MEELEKVQIKEGDVIDIINNNVPTIEDIDENKQNILQANNIIFGEELGEIKQQVDVDESEKRFGLTNQLNDLLDDLLSTIPTYKRTPKELRNIHILIERYRELREKYSYVDELGNTNAIPEKGNMYKPIVQTIKNLNRKLYWILPVVQNKKKLYDTSDFQNEFNEEEIELEKDERGQYGGSNVELEITKDYETYKSINSFKEQSEISERFVENKISSDDKYGEYFQLMRPFNTPYLMPESNKNLLMFKNVEDNLQVLVNNLENMESTVSENQEIKNRKFVIEQYNLGLKRLSTKEKSSRLLVDVVPLTQNDKLPLSSIVTLPLPFIKYSSLYLPASNIYNKANLNRVSLPYFQYLHRNKNINNVPINNNEYYVNETILDSPQSYELITKNKDITPEENVNKYLENIIPSTNTIIYLMKNNLREKYSFNKVVDELEPFFIFHDTITDEHRKSINTILKENITYYLSNIQKYNSQTFLPNLISDKPPTSSLYELIQTNDTLLNFYQITETMENEEIIKQITVKDCGKLFNLAISQQSLDLFSFGNIEKTVETAIQQIENDINNETEKPEESCEDNVLTKKYVDMDELEADNEKETYFDKKYDTTQYDILESYPRINMTAEEYETFVTTKLIETIGLKENDAIYDAASMINGRRIVKDGQYCVLEQQGKEGVEYKYFKRIENKWIYDEEVTKKSFGDKTRVFCNLQDTCIQINKQCIDSNSNIEQKNLLDKISDTFQKDYLISKDDLDKKLNKENKYLVSIINKIKLLENYRKFKYDYLKLKLGLMLEKREIVTSPNLNLLQNILQQSDFVEKQSNLIKFAKQLTREAKTEESVYFRYCIETDVPLMPTFLLTLSEAFQRGDYLKALDYVCKERGTLSDSGDMWVDKHSGFTIRHVEESTDEGYDAQGFRIQTKDVIQEQVMFGSIAEKKELNEQEKLVLNVINSLTNHIGVSIVSEEQYIIGEVTSYILKKIGSKSDYKKKNEGKKIPQYKTLLNTYLLFQTVSYVIIMIQTFIPSLKSNKTFPGCVRSLRGFPLDDETNTSMVHYVSCIMDKMKSDNAPWKAIRKLNIEKIEGNIIKTIKEILSTNTIIKDKLVTKRNNSEKEFEQELVPQIHSINRWKTFLPPLVTVQLKSVKTISQDYENLLKKSIIDGNKNQTDKLLGMRSKLIFISLFITENIESIVKKEELLLKNGQEQAFLQNSCCNNGNINTLDYFIEKEPKIKELNEQGYKIMNMYYLYENLSRARYLFSNTDTKLKYPPLGNKISEENIYRAFLYYCKFNQDISLDSEFLKICALNTSNFKKTDSFEDKMKILKSEGKNYSQDDLKFLMDIVARKNEVDINIYSPIVTNEKQSSQYLEYILSSYDETSEFYNGSKLLKELLDSTKQDNKKNYDALRNFLLRENVKLEKEIIDFVEDHKGNMKTRKFITFIKEIKEWNTLEKDLLFNDDQIKGEKIREFLTQSIIDMGAIYPNIVLHQKFKSKKFIISDYTTLSDNHLKDINNYLFRELEPLHRFYNKESIDTLMKIVLRENISIVKLVRLLPSMSYSLTKDLFIFLFFVTMINYIKLQTIIEELSEEQQQEGLDLEQIDELNKNVSQILINYVSIFDYRKSKISNFNKETIQKRIYKEKEDEKNSFTRRFEVLSDEDRKLEDTYKNLKLGKYNVGQVKGLFEYSGDVYDQEREAAEEDIAQHVIDETQAYDMTDIPDEGEEQEEYYANY